MILGTRSVKNPRRGFSRKHRRKDRLPNPEGLYNLPKPRSFTSAYGTHLLFNVLFIFLAIGSLVTTAPGILLVILCVNVSALIVCYLHHRHTQKQIEHLRSADLELGEEVAEHLS
tara:strand:- start:628 stop:972 length:345 start_codon:yes stop_codon:yes gene_type:complete